MICNPPLLFWGFILAHWNCTFISQYFLLYYSFLYFLVKPVSSDFFFLDLYYMCIVFYLSSKILNNGMLRHLGTNDKSPFDLLLYPAQKFLVFFCGKPFHPLKVQVKSSTQPEESKELCTEITVLTKLKLTDPNFAYLNMVNIKLKYILRVTPRVQLIMIKIHPTIRCWV